ncbi:MAG: radical SAM protein [bacterium]|nr:B12-binding domain-containing radical SAM protein [Planctomycetota bacterium]HIL53106.1 B12-binding domain-containing radical SAM protein [Planctomycetota bacterium]
MRKTLVSYVKPHVQEDPLAMVLGIAYLGAMMEKEGLPIALADERIMTDAEMRRAIDENDIIGFGALTPNIRRAVVWAKYAKQQKKITVMGGPHASVDPGVFLDSGHFDYVLKGEAEHTLPQFVRALEAGDEKSLAELPGLSAMRDGQLAIDNPAPPLIKRLDDLPLPARHLLPMKRYFDANPEQLVYVFTTRGCPFKCIFCQKELTGRGFRVRSTEMIVDEVEQVVKTYNPGVVLFVDEILTLRKKRIHEMCDEIIRRGLKFEWIANTRADCVDYPLLKHMHRAGCRRIYYGWESGSQRMLDVLKKDLTPEEIIEAAKMTRRAGIWAKVYLIVGSPGETAEDIEESEKVLRLAGPDLVRVSVFNPLVGTESWDGYQANIDVDDLRENYVSSNRSAYRHENFSGLELEELRKDLVRRYEKWYYAYPQRTKRFMERCLYYLENPAYGRKRLGRAVGLVPPPQSSNVMQQARELE